jgi:hypothetical protein
VPFGLEEHELRDRIGNKMIRPTTIPQTLDELKIEQAIAREALRLAFIQHRQFAVKLRGVQQERTIADAFSQETTNTLVDMMKLDLLVGSGGVLSHAPRRMQSMLMMIDAFQVEGITELAVDSIFMMPHLGLLSTVHPAAATEVFLKDCLIRLGTCIAPVGMPRRRAPFMVDASLTTTKGVSKREQLRPGELRHMPLGPDEIGILTLRPSHGVDVGAGPGHELRKEVRGGVCGLIFDGRGRRPFRFPVTARERVAATSKWNDVLDLYPGVAA